MFEETYLKLGLFIFGCSPGGGASNMWAVLLGGNLNLSITMTFLSTLLSFAAMPFWLYTLGRTIWVDTTTVPPVRSILTTLGSMLIFLGIGLTIKRYVPRLANVSVGSFEFLCHQLTICSFYSKRSAAASWRPSPWR